MLEQWEFRHPEENGKSTIAREFFLIKLQLML